MLKHFHHLAGQSFLRYNNIQQYHTNIIHYQYLQFHHSYKLLNLYSLYKNNHMIHHHKEQFHHNYKRLDLWAAADRWNQSLTELDWVLAFLNQAEDDRQTAISELSVYTLTIGDRGGCLAQLRKFSIA